ncbi:MAG: rRNA pseudouridine synthase [Desulfovibrionaceae bacterium]|nr:rRNA pseudouridine synthase [Desulfovibrionaceae bacterium]
MSDSGIRINKALTGAGWCSRRKADEWIAAGLVLVNGQKTVPGQRLRPGDLLRAGDRELRVGEDGLPAVPGGPLYLMLHKPAGVVSTLADPQGRETVLQLLPGEYAGRRVFPVGRLDFFSEGLLLLTDDGELTRRLTHPSFHLPKYYELLVREGAGDEELARMRSGMTLAEGETLAPVEVERLGRKARGELLRLTLRQGVNRQIRRMCRDLGLTVLRLRRVGQGPLSLGSLSAGGCRPLKEAEVLALKQAVGLL